ncbi:MAG TPA: hypothetical protein VFN68_15100 [Acidimicrobiales bacterium]|nr:hypothetical protein [Acidimicrobiales bacterium]
MIASSTIGREAAGLAEGIPAGVAELVATVKERLPETRPDVPRPEVSLQDLASRLRLPDVDVADLASRLRRPEVDVSDLVSRLRLPDVDVADLAAKVRLPDVDVADLAAKVRLPEIDVADIRDRLRDLPAVGGAQAGRRSLAVRLAVPAVIAGVAVGAVVVLRRRRARRARPSEQS